MNLVIKNQNYKVIDSLNIDIIKTMHGEFDRNDLEKELVNFVCNKVIVDITAIKNYFDVMSVMNFLSYFEAEKIIILLNDSELVNGKGFLSQLVEYGYYNFTRNAAGITYLLEHPNKRDDVQNYINTDNVSVNEVVENYSTPSAPIVQEAPEFKKGGKQKIIGIQSLTPHAGATTLMYMMVKQLSNNYSVKGIEMFNQDSIYFHNNDLSLCTSLDDLKLKIKNFANNDIIIIDLNDLDAKEICDETLFLLEPGVIRLNKLLKGNPGIYEKIRNEKVILNRSSIKNEELSSFEYETKIKVFFNLTNFNERKERIQIIDSLLIKLGFKNQNVSGGLFGLFK